MLEFARREIVRTRQTEKLGDLRIGGGDEPAHGPSERGRGDGQCGERVTEIVLAIAETRFRATVPRGHSRHRA